MSALTSVVELYPLLLPELPNCPTPLLLQVLQQTIRDFCVQSDLWRETLTMNVVADQADYTLAPTDTSSQVQRVVSVSISDVEQLQRYITFNPTNSEITLDDDIIPTAAETNGLDVVISLCPHIGYPTTTFNAGMLNRWAEAFCMGAKARLMLMPQKDWSNGQLGMMYNQQFLTQVALARREVWTGYKNGTMSVAPRTW